MQARTDGLLCLKAWLHPSLNVPFTFDAERHKFYVSPAMEIVDLMENFEEVFIKVSKEAPETRERPLELMVHVMWNTRDHKKALNPSERVGHHFSSGDTFGVYGDIQAYEEFVEKKEEEKIPVTILTGFLGAGKTTLLNYILREQREMKIAIIENEFGEVSIDDALLKHDKTAFAERVVVMENGCVCCTIRGDLENGLLEIVDDIKAGAGIDAIMIESTGMADPVPIMRTFMSSDRLTLDLRLDAVVALADAKHLVGRLDDDVEQGKVNIAYQQIAFADRIILNKLDLVDAEQAIACRDRIRGVNKFAKILPAVCSNVRLSEITNVQAHSMANFAREDIALEAHVAPELADGHAGHGSIDSGHGGHGQNGHDHQGHGGHEVHCGHEGHTGHEGHGGHQGEWGRGDGHAADVPGGSHLAGLGHDALRQRIRHDGRVNSFSIVREGELHSKRLAHWIQRLRCLNEDKGTIYRIKGIFAVHGHPEKFVFHAVMDVSDDELVGPWAEGEKKVCKIVFIGKSLDEKYLRDGFDALFV